MARYADFARASTDNRKYDMRTETTMDPTQARHEMISANLLGIKADPTIRRIDNFCALMREFGLHKDAVAEYKRRLEEQFLEGGPEIENWR